MVADDELRAGVGTPPRIPRRGASVGMTGHSEPSLSEGSFFSETTVWERPAQSTRRTRGKQMKENHEISGRSDTAARKSTGDALSETEIRRRLISDAVQHPATLLPAAATGALAIYAVLLAPVFGGGPWPAVLLFTTAAAAAGGFVWQYALHYSDAYAKAVRELAERDGVKSVREQAAKTGRLRERLQDGLLEADAGHGLNVLNGLVREYELLASNSRRNDLLYLHGIDALVDETYRRGISVLGDALDLLKAAKASGRERVETEVAQLEKDAESADEDRRGFLRDMLAAHRKRLEMLDLLQLRIDELVYQAYRCETSLQHTRIELAGIRAGSSETSVDSVTEALNSTINQAKEVQMELKRLGY